MTAIYVLWIIGLVLALLLVLLAVYWLTRLLITALRVKRYTAEMLTAGLGIAGNTQHISALQDTIRTAGTMLSTADSINEHAEAIEHLLRSRADRIEGGQRL